MFVANHITQMEPAHLRMARTGGAVGLGFDLEPPPPSVAAPKTTSAAVLPKMQKPPEAEMVFVDEDDVKYEVVKDEANAKEQAGLIRAATLERLVNKIVWFVFLKGDSNVSVRWSD